MKLKPIGKNIILEPQKPEDHTKFGIIIPTASEDKPEIGIVIARGPAATDMIAEGDKVLFKKYAPDEVDLDGTKYLICEDSDILAIMENEK